MFIGEDWFSSGAHTARTWCEAPLTIASSYGLGVCGGDGGGEVAGCASKLGDSVVGAEVASSRVTCDCVPWEGDGSCQRSGSASDARCESASACSARVLERVCDAMQEAVHLRSHWLRLQSQGGVGCTATGGRGTFVAPKGNSGGEGGALGGGPSSVS